MPGFFNEKRCVLVLITLFVLMSFLISAIPYNPSKDLADGTTNDIWLPYYSKGVFSVPYNLWTQNTTQSVVVLHNGVYTVVNEKGPGQVLLMVPFYVLGVTVLYGPFMVAIAAISSYMLGKRLLNWKVGALAALFVMTDLSVIMMWFRSYWNDASTMHTLVLSIWLLIEAVYLYNGRSLDPHSYYKIDKKFNWSSLGLATLSGLVFGISVSTRYATALMIIPMISFLLTFYIIKSWPDILKLRLWSSIKRSRNMFLLLGAFAVGFICVLVPLMHYNSEYFGGPLKSGYDATVLSQFSNSNTLAVRNTEASWVSSLSNGLSTALSNFVMDFWILASRMPFMLLLPIGAWFARKNRPTLVLLFLWIFVNFFTYLSISWMDIYATQIPSDILFEPRYFLPAVPAIALLAGAAIYEMILMGNRLMIKLTGSKKNLVVGSVAIGLVCVLVLCSILPAIQFFSNPAMLVDTSQHNPPPNGPSPKQNPPGPPSNGGRVNPGPQTNNLSSSDPHIVALIPIT